LRLGDYNNDGFLDLFVPNEMGLKSFLYRNNGDGSFTKITQGDVVNTVAQSLAAAWADYDNDGFLDLLVVNGRMGFVANHLYRNQGDGTFLRVTNIAPATDLGTWHGATWGDYDNDGFLDLFVANWGSTNALYHNDGNSNAWLKVKLRGTVSNRDGIGAKVRVKATVWGRCPLATSAGIRRRWRHPEQHRGPLRIGRRHQYRSGAHRVALGHRPGIDERSGTTIPHPSGKTAPDSRKSRRRISAHGW